MITIPNTEKKYNQEPTQLQIKIPINSTMKGMEECDYNKVVESEDIFFRERNESCCFRIHGNILPVMDNCLVSPETVEEIRDQYSRSGIFGITDFLTNSSLKRANIGDKGGWHYYLDNDDVCKSYPFKPEIKKFDICGNDNWCFKLAYINECEDLDFNGINLSDGLAILQSSAVTYYDFDYFQLSTYLKHNLKQGDLIKIFPSEEIIEVKHYVDDYTFYLEEHFSEVDMTHFRKIEGGHESEYYIQKATFISDVEVDISGFQKSVYGDSIISFKVDDIDLCSYTDCHGKPIDKVYLIAIKNHCNDYWTDIKMGLDINPLSDLYNINRNVTDLGDINCDSESIYCNVVEYNKLLQTENTISDVSIKFNSTIRQEFNMTEHYVYKPCCPIKFRNYSSYVENDGTLEVLNVPDYAVKINDTLYWRDLLDYGIIDDTEDFVDRPFLNGCHYIYEHHIICLNRQNSDCNFDYSGYDRLYPEIIGVTCPDIEEPIIDTDCSPFSPEIDQFTRSPFENLLGG